MSLPDSPVYPEAKELAQTWRSTVERDLKGADFNKRLVTQTYDGINIQPLYNPVNQDNPEAASGMPGSFPHTRGNDVLSTSLNGWEIQQTYDLSDTGLNQTILTDLAKGVSSIHLVATTQATHLENVSAALKDVHLDMASIYLDGGAHAEQAAQVLSSLIDAHAQQASGSFMQDPIGSFAQGHPVAGSLETALSKLATLAKTNQDQFPKMRTASVSTEVYHAAGASDAQCLAYAMSTALNYLRAMETKGLSIEQAASQIGFHLSLDARFFASIAVIRACRTLWSKITKSCGAPTGAWIRIHPAGRILTKRDPWVNQLRNTATTFAGAVAGADAITTLPWDATLQAPDAFGRRVARNTQLVLGKESHLSRVIDPAGGSYFIEALTCELCEKAWAIFQDIEKQGGIQTALRSGTVQSEIDKVYAQREQALAKRKQAITGVNQFPNLDEESFATQDVAAPHAASNQDGTESMQGLVARPDAQAFETFRDKSDVLLASSGNRPSLFLANLGTIAQHTGRASFSANLFAAGGIESVTGVGSNDAQELANAFKASQAKVAVICGTDALYTEHAQAIANALRSAGASWVVLAGRPGKEEKALREAGVQDFIYLGCNTLESIANVWQHWEAKS